MKNRRSRRHGSGNGNAASAADGSPPAGARPAWSGTISFGLVVMPVNLFPAVRPAEATLRQLGPGGEPLQRRFVCPEEGKDMEQDQLVRGYEVAEGRHVVLTDAELEAIAPRKSRDIELRRFVPVDSLDPFLFERAYVLTPASEATLPYRLLADAMEREGKAGIATFVMRTKEYLVALLARDGILWAETLRFADEVRTPKAVGLPAAPDVDAREVAAMKRLIQSLAEKSVGREQLVEARSVRLRALAEKKLARGEDVVEAPADAAAAVGSAEPDEAPDLFDTIRRSLQLVRGKGPGGGNGKGAHRARATGSGPRLASPRSAPAAGRRSRAKGRRGSRAASARSAP